jgi:hypothetical protein
MGGMFVLFLSKYNVEWNLFSYISDVVLACTVMVLRFSAFTLLSNRDPNETVFGFVFPHHKNPSWLQLKQTGRNNIKFEASKL